MPFEERTAKAPARERASQEVIAFKGAHTFIFPIFIQLISNFDLRFFELPYVFKGFYSFGRLTFSLLTWWKSTRFGFPLSGGSSSRPPKKKMVHFGID